MARVTNMTYWNLLPDFSRKTLKEAAEETRRQDKEQGK